MSATLLYNIHCTSFCKFKPESHSQPLNDTLKLYLPIICCISYLFDSDHIRVHKHKSTQNTIILATAMTILKHLAKYHRISKTSLPTLFSDKNTVLLTIFNDCSFHTFHAIRRNRHDKLAKTWLNFWTPCRMLQ